MAVVTLIRFFDDFRLCDVVQSEGRLYLVFEFVDKDLKKYFEACDGPLSASLIKVIDIIISHQIVMQLSMDTHDIPF